MSVLSTHGGHCRRRVSWGNSSTGWRKREAAPTPLLEAHEALGNTLFYLGEYNAAWAHLEQESALAESVA